MRINPITGLEEEEIEIPEVEPQQNPVDVKDYVMKKYNLGPYSEENRNKIEQENSGYDLSGRTGAALAALGAGFMGRDPSSAANAVLDRNQKAKDARLANFDKSRANKIQEIALSRESEKSDPNSRASMAFRKNLEANFPKIAQAYGDNWNNIAASDQESIFKPLQLREQIEARKEQARILAGQRSEAAETRKALQEQRLDEKQQALKTPFGMANTEDDAKKLKEAYESKKNFDNKINEMIALREKHGGGAILNREDVGRGKQLSKDLLLEYKNMAKLGVLSQSDENIINAIIPEDPLEFSSLTAAIQGQDPILHRLKSFKGDSDKDFMTRIQTRTRDGGAKYAESLPPSKNENQKSIVKTQTNQKTGEKRIVYSDGSTEIIKSVAGGR